MIEIILGGNGFRNCRTIVAVDGRPLLSAWGDGCEVELRVPGRTSVPTSAIVLQGNRISGDDAYLTRELTIRSHEDEVRVFFQSALLFAWSRLSETSAHVHLDLRPLGLRVFSDSEGLHVGPHSFFNLLFQSESPAISVSSGEGQGASDNRSA